VLVFLRKIVHLVNNYFTMEIIELDINAIVIGIGRKATDEELIRYLVKEADAVPISLEIAFSKYSDNTNL